MFGEIGTTNFETVLEAVMHAEMVLRAMAKDTSDVDALYAQVRDALFATVHKVHVRHAALPTPTLHTLGEVIDGHRSVFTTNYDLLPYWALMETPHTHIADFFWGSGNTFDAESTEVFSGFAALYYLHGGVHLWQSDLTGLTGKWTNQGHSLLQAAGQYSAHGDRRPLFVSEGTTQAKQRTIRRSDYLSFALEAFREDQANAVVFGHGLSGQDAHVLAALRRGSKRRIAVSIRPSSRAHVLATKTRVREQLEGHDVVFFDATSHPLGDASLTVPNP